MWILLIEDEIDLATSLKRGLEEEGYTVDVAADGEEGETLASVNDYDLLVVDWRLPRRDGRTVVKNLRASDRTFPILMLTAMGGVEHRVEGLDAGADDYLTKPFSFEELLARLRSLLRRGARTLVDEALSFGPVEINTGRRSVRTGGEELLLRPKEYSLLEILMRKPDRVVTRSVIAERVWGSAFSVTDHVIDVTVSSLRKKLLDAQRQFPGLEQSDAEPSVAIETVRGVGYRLNLKQTSEA